MGPIGPIGKSFDFVKCIIPDAFTGTLILDESHVGHVETPTWRFTMKVHVGSMAMTSEELEKIVSVEENVSKRNVILVFALKCAFEDYIDLEGTYGRVLFRYYDFHQYFGEYFVTLPMQVSFKQKCPHCVQMKLTPLLFYSL